MIFEIILAIFFIIISVSLLLFVPLIFGAPFEPSEDKRIKSIIKLANPKKTDLMVDLGSGDGRIVFAFADMGIESHGYEINPWLVLYSKIMAKKLSLKNAHFHWTSFWDKDLSQFTIITLFQINYIMNRLEKKLNKEAEKGTRIISNKWEFPGLKIVKKENNVKKYVM